jgi:hypothetical protein
MKELDAIATIERIVAKNSEIEFVKVFELNPSPPLQERIKLNDHEKELIEEALRIRRATEFSFWDSLMATTMGSQPAPLRLLDQALHHNRSDSGVNLVTSKEIERGHLRDLCSERSSAFAICSRVKLNDGSHGHLGMLDFNCSVSTPNLELASEIATRIAGAGYLLESGESFHFYSEALIPEGSFVSFLGRALLFAPAVDRAWIAHQLIEGEAALRVSAHPALGWPPRVVARIGPHR